MTRRIWPLLALILVAASCGGGGSSADTSGGGSGDSEELTLSIDAPADGDEVSLPFTLEFSSSVELGPTDTGAHHVHVYYDDNEDEYEVVESTTYDVTELPAGNHEIYASLRNADHSDTGVEAEIEVAVTGGGSSGKSEKKDEGDGGYDY